jgi:hypothetical protein
MFCNATTRKKELRPHPSLTKQRKLQLLFEFSYETFSSQRCQFYGIDYLFLKLKFFLFVTASINFRLCAALQITFCAISQLYYFTKKMMQKILDIPSCLPEDATIWYFWAIECHSLLLIWVPFLASSMLYGTVQYYLTGIHSPAPINFNWQ